MRYYTTGLAHCMAFTGCNLNAEPVRFPDTLEIEYYKKKRRTKDDSKVLDLSNAKDETASN